jgi:XrtJ-associated TM-motif-TM protein
MSQIVIKEKTMKRMKFLLAISIVLLATSPLRLHALDGCVDSPEDPTAVLALVGVAAAFGEYARRRFWATKASKNNR